MRPDRPDVSVIIAAYRAEDFIITAVQSALAQQHASLEVIVAPDDDVDYRFLKLLDSRIRVLDPRSTGTLPTGPAATRNRALSVARGRFIALLDADDYWSPNYLARLLPLAADRGLAFGRTVIADWGGETRRAIPHRASTDSIGYPDFAAAYGSLHAVVRFESSGEVKRQWHDLLAEDVLFDVESLAMAGGTAPYADDAVYWLRIRAQSMSHGADFISGIDAGYEAIINRIQCGGTLIPVSQMKSTISIFRAWQAMNARFSQDHAQNPQLEFHAYIADRMQQLPSS